MASPPPSDTRPAAEEVSSPAPKKIKLSDTRDSHAGVADIKPEYLLPKARKAISASADDDAVGAAHHHHYQEAENGGGGKKRKHERGQNKARKFHFANDEVKLCNSLVMVPREGLFEGTVCEFALNARPKGQKARQRRKKKEEVEVGKATGEDKIMEGREEEEWVQPDGLSKKCGFSHNLREYLKSKRDDSEGVCPVWELRGYCGSGWRCRWVGSHSKEDENGELYMVVDEGKKKIPQQWEEEVPIGGFYDPYGEIINSVPMSLKIRLRKNEFPTKKSEVYAEWEHKEKTTRDGLGYEDKGDARASFVDAPVNAAEKRRIYIGKETPLLAPLTTTGNLPFRRLCSRLGAALTYSEMAMSVPLLQGHKPEWALLRAHASEIPNFGAQICGTKIGTAVRATEVLTTLFPSAASSRHGLSLVDLNCGCPIDLVYRQGGGSALLDQPSKLIKMLKGMNYVSGETPITCKIRLGTRDSSPVAKKLVQRIYDAGDVQAITLHGRSRQQRYSRDADWTYIAETAALIKDFKRRSDTTADTAIDKEARDKPNVFFVGNGDCYSHVDYYNSIDQGNVDGVMLARGALIKPWLFEEIQKGQYLDKSATERLDYIREYVRYGLECWGSDELGVATTRRFLLEWLSFGCRYVPIGILERLPPRIQDRPPPWKGRNELECLLGGSDYKDWIKISEMFLGPCPSDFHFTPKHKVCVITLCLG
ncbi:unnamed protein product [Tuber melanosporum]|uniref:tRNA-dihydrouridine(47) synthase [NAD(P)(+)] n=1 Tax=Tuber melanosporum (strain Mel28) TaxID=656061 RepID=D5GJC6_TUBMM|nr:uncharacterized protein GSTUM_00008939001 [Tuber melanosporum]CAZ84619.1 unnamed protein product [Tuber melanosporum]